MTSSKTALLSAAVTFAFFSTPALPHDFWINHGNYKSPADGVHCCGDNDCKMLSPEEVKVSPRGYVLMNGELVPFAEVQPSEDGEYWRCKRYDGSRRCFFAPQPSS
jgi:hypothetical protein